jgi:hypothetical protein
MIFTVTWTPEHNRKPIGEPQFRQLARPQQG